MIDHLQCGTAADCHHLLRSIAEQCGSLLTDEAVGVILIDRDVLDAAGDRTQDDGCVVRYIECDSDSFEITGELGL